MGKYKATIIILNWNGQHLLRRCLPSVIQAVNYDGGGHEILVIDNGSTDGSAQFVLSNYPGVAVLPLPENRGFVGGYNAGLAIARQHLVVLLNNSTWVRADFFTNLLTHFENPDVFGVSPKILTPTGLIEVEYLHATWDGRGIIGQKQPGFNEPDRGRVGGPCYTFYAPGGCSAFNRAKLMALGWFHPIYAPFHWEEVDISYRAWKRGWKVMYEPRAVAWHEAGSTFSKHVPAEQNKLIWHRNRLLFLWSNLSDPEMVRQHHSYLPVWATLDPLHSQSLQAARAFMVQADQKRTNDQPHWQLSDKEVFNLIGACCSGVRPNGSLVKGTGSDVYLLEGAGKRHVPSRAVLDSFSNWLHVIPIGDQELAAYPLMPAVDFREGCLLASPDRTAYIVSRGRKHPVASLQRLAELGRSAEEIIPVSWEDLRRLKEGGPA